MTLVKCEKCGKFYEAYKKHICKKKDIHKYTLGGTEYDRERD